ncbi:hypothetical protein ACFQ36_11745 [Arthrobacter sp. GCM10027362]|uniref:hypothetical protein n=1 Tax=Arthrobacter sp. GCM10027362 TaxID=3273379 RepID=UPI0036315663
MFRFGSKEAPPEDPALILEKWREQKDRGLKDFDADIANLQSMHEHLYELAAGSPDRAKSAAETVQKASAAIVTLYTGVLALVFSVSGTQLPLRGVLAPIFLGLAVVLSTGYLAYIVRETDKTILTNAEVQALAATEGLEPVAYARLNAFIKISQRLVERRLWMLRASVVSLGVGLVGITLPFLSSSAPVPSGQLQAAIESSMPWPTPTPGATGPNEQVLFKAQVDEVASSRLKARTMPPPSANVLNSDEFFYWSLGVGVVIVVVGAVGPALKRRDTSAS